MKPHLGNYCNAKSTNYPQCSHPCCKFGGSPGSSHKPTGMLSCSRNKNGIHHRNVSFSSVPLECFYQSLFQVNVPLMKCLQVERELLVPSEWTFRNKMTCFGSHSDFSPRVSPGKACSIRKEALNINFFASGVTKLKCDLFRGFQLKRAQ